MITGTTIKQLNIYSIKNSEIEYDAPKVPGLFNFIIAVGPIIGCSFAIILVSIIVKHPIQIKGSLPGEITFSVNPIIDYLRNYLDTIWLSFNDFREHGFSTLKSSTCIIFSIIFAVSMAPRKNEIKYIVPGFIILGLVLFVLEKCGISFLDYTWWQEALSDSWMIVTYIVSILLTILVISLIILRFIKGFRLVFGHKN